MALFPQDKLVGLKIKLNSRVATRDLDMSGYELYKDARTVLRETFSWVSFLMRVFRP